jgi:glucokinase
MLLAGDLGGTKTLLGLYRRAPGRPQPLAVTEFATGDYAALGPMVAEFLASVAIAPAAVEAAAIGVAGPVLHDEATLTNVPWRVSIRELVALGLRRVALLNDVEAMAYAVDVLDATEQVILQEGAREPLGTSALVSVGTGLGMAIIARLDHAVLPRPSEGGHADFAARTEREIALLRTLRPKYGRVDIERVVSGPGLANVARFTHGGACPRFPPTTAPEDEPAQVSRAALEGTCLSCREALDMFVEALGAVAGNLALTTRATGGLFVGGGVPVKILPALQGKGFLSAFGAKPPSEALLRVIPVTVVILAEAGLLGAATYANRM